MSIQHARKMQMLDVHNTSLIPPSQCANRKENLTLDECLPNWLTGNVSSPVVPPGVPGMLCPLLTFSRDKIPVLSFIQVRKKSNKLLAVMYGIAK